MTARSAPRSVDELEERLSAPRDATVAALRASPGDVVVLGAGGKMGPTLVAMLTRAAMSADGARPRRVHAVSRYSSPEAAAAIERAGAVVHRSDLLDPDAVARLPDAPNVIFMAGQKFGTGQSPGRTWMMNVAAPALCARRYASSIIVAFSTGNVYPMVPVTSGGAAGATEDTPPEPVGDYAQSCAMRERVFQLASSTWGTRVALMRLNYANDLRYGVITDIAVRVLRGDPVDVAMGFVNVIWQGDASRAAIELLPRAASPPFVLNVSGGATLAVRRLAEELGKRLGTTPVIRGSEAPDALLADTARYRATLGGPEMPLGTLLDWTAEWVRAGRPLLDKPTHFEVRTGQF